MVEGQRQKEDPSSSTETGAEEKVYEVITVAEGDLEARLNAAHRAGRELVTTQVRSLSYGLGGEYHLKEVLVVLRRIAAPA